MSSSDPRPVQATPWALDEFAAHDIFPVAAPLAGSIAAELGAEPSEHQRQVDDRNAAEAAGYARGLAEGEQRARAAFEGRVAAAVNALSGALESIRLHEARWMSNIGENIAAIAVTVARHIVQREIATDATIIQTVVQRALTQLPVDQTVIVRLNPDDHSICSSSLPDDMRARDIRWVADPHITRGGCLVEGRERIIDGRVDTALERLYSAIGKVQT